MDNSNKAKLFKLARESRHIVYEISSVFPFQLFPDKVILDENKVTVIRKELFFKRVISIPYSDILTVKADRGILFAALDFEIKRIDYHLRPINYL